MASECSEETEMDTQCEICFDLAELEKNLKAEMTAFEAPCTGSDTGECWIFENLTPWNNVLKEIGYAIEEYETGKAILRPMNTFLLVSTLEDFVQRGFFLFYKLLKLHHCVKSLEVAGHLPTIRCVSVVNVAVAGSTALESLKVVSSPEDPHHGEPLVEGIQNITTLQHITLQGLSLSATSAKEVAKVLANNRYLKSVTLCGLEADARDMTTILDALERLGDLTELAVVERGFNAATAKAISHLINGLPHITKLDLSNQHDLIRRDYLYDEEDLSTRQEDKGEAVKILCETLMANETVKVLDLKHSRIYDDGAEHLAAALKKNTTLQEINLEDSDIEDAGIKALADALKSNNTLEVLNLNLNVVCEVGARSLAEAMIVNRKLRRLSLYGTHFGLSTCRTFVEALDRNATIEQVGIGCLRYEFEEAEGEEFLSIARDRRIFRRMDVQWNGASLRELAHALQGSDDIHRVEVPWLEDLAEEETREVLEAICKNSSVVELHIVRDGILPGVVPALVQLLKTTKTLKTVEILLEPSDAPVFDEVMDALAENTSITRLELKCYMLNRHAGAKLGDMLKRNQSIHELVLNDASTEFSIGGDPPHLSLARDMESNRTLLKIKNSHAWFPQEGLYRIEEVLRRNWRLLRRAATFVSNPVWDRTLASDFSVLSRADSLVEYLVKVTGKKDLEVRNAIREARDFVRQNFIDL